MMAFVELKGKFEALKDMKKEEETNVRYHETKVQNMVIGYLIWARSFFFFFFAITSQTSMSFKCQDWWLILASTLFCTFLYFLLFLDAVVTFFRAHDQLDLIRFELMGVCKQILVNQNQDGVEARGFDHDFCFHEKMLELDRFTTTVEKKFYLFFVVCALLAITAIELHVSKYLFCN